MGDQIITKTIFDTSMYGLRDSSGSIKDLWGKEALSNALIQWLTLKKGEVLRRPDLGGVLDPWITKPLTDLNAKLMVRVIQANIESNFTPYLQLVSLNVTPDYEKRAWFIEIEAYSPEYKVPVDLSTYIKNLT